VITKLILTTIENEESSKKKLRNSIHIQHQILHVMALENTNISNVFYIRLKLPGTETNHHMTVNHNNYHLFTSKQFHFTFYSFTTRVDNVCCWQLYQILSPGFRSRPPNRALLLWKLRYPSCL